MHLSGLGAVLMLVSFEKLPGFVAEIVLPFAPCRNHLSSLGTDDKRLSRAATTSAEMSMLHKGDNGQIPNFRDFSSCHLLVLWCLLSFCSSLLNNSLPRNQLEFPLPPAPSPKASRVELPVSSATSASITCSRSAGLVLFQTVVLYCSTSFYSDVHINNWMPLVGCNYTPESYPPVFLCFFLQKWVGRCGTRDYSFNKCSHSEVFSTWACSFRTAVGLCYLYHPFTWCLHFYSKTLNVFGQINQYNYTWFPTSGSADTLRSGDDRPYQKQCEGRDNLCLNCSFESCHLYSW